MGRMIRSGRRAQAPPLCSVCDARGKQEPILLCVDCAHPDRVRTYCAACHGRLDLSLGQAQELFLRAGLTVRRTGVVFFYADGCPECCPDAGSDPDVYVLNTEEELLDGAA
ncbi:hypothetical protein HY631_02770 [Candidatus Uhrbacteria bacterium]|nr:hypothetical protein [Candidatus Uhrbacteria bacterium]